MLEIRARDSDAVLWRTGDDTLVGASLAGLALPGADLAGADLRGAALRGADTCKARLTGANLQQAVDKIERAGREALGAQLAEAGVAASVAERVFGIATLRG